ncbi:MAG: hypothetical protein NW703_03280 [Nitrospiraceae bacterium]
MKAWRAGSLPTGKSSSIGSGTGPVSSLPSCSNGAGEGIAAYCHQRDMVKLDFIEGLSSTIQVIQRSTEG